MIFNIQNTKYRSEGNLFLAFHFPNEGNRLLCCT